jgi:hypothetical protein
MMKRMLASVAAMVFAATAAQGTEEATWGQVKADQELEPGGKLTISAARAGGRVDHVVRMTGNSDPADFTEVFPEIPEPDNSYLKTLEWSWTQAGTFVGARGEIIKVAGQEISVCQRVRGNGMLRGKLEGLSAGTYHFVATELAVAGNRAVILGTVTHTRVQLGDPSYVVGDEILIWIEDGDPDRKLALWSVDTFRTLNPTADFDTHGAPAGLLLFVAREGGANTPFGMTQPFAWENGGVHIRSY